ncbi:hypothetical protein [Chitinophaga niabensis]|uniref:Uncharacterized protein n=1 Tax=Chitinophaga niabensis TaxID=536979 RepID=A0A1N6E487_9BACT|nr:hypothetical protein [Chitinophaga niabensis]SIN77832.1 hypothetical protein SAMN04488055_1291 [Chitinophaga niabensis]
MKKNQYELEWLDDVVSIQLNPDVKGSKDLSSEETNKIKQRIETEEREVLSRLKNRLFRVPDEAASRSLVKKYHDDLVLMITKNYSHLHHPAVMHSGLKELHEFIGARLHYILFLFEKELSSFLNTENLVPITELLIQKTQILERADDMRKNLATGEYGMAPVDIVMEVIEDYISKIDNRVPITLRESSYIRELMHDVLSIDGNLTSITGCDAINELLIIWNLNSKNCIRYFTTGTQMLMDSKETEEEKLAFLKLESKKLDIIPERQNFVLDPDFPSVKEYCYKWLNNEIAYRENRLEGFVPLAREEARKEMKENAFKAVVSMSVDQLSLILRALFDLRIILAKSMSAAFKAITPYLSTPLTENINWDNARTKSYVAEESDKQIVIAKLEELIRLIRSY